MNNACFVPITVFYPEFLPIFLKFPGIYELNIENKVRNYILEFVEMGLDFAPLKAHFVVEEKFSEETWNDLVKEANELHNKKPETEKPEVSEKQLLSEIATLRKKLSKVEKKKCCKT